MRQWAKDVRLRDGTNVVWQLGCAMIAAGLSYFFYRSGISGFPAVLWFVFAGLVILRCLTFAETYLVSPPDRIVQRWRFLGLVLLWTRGFSVESFTGIQQRHRRGYDDSVWQVGLVRRSGRFVSVKSFASSSVNGPCVEANLYAVELAGATRLPLLETAVTET